jgi:hypothetical protein
VRYEERKGEGEKRGRGEKGKRRKGEGEIKSSETP